MIHGAELRVHFLKSFQKGSTCENLSQKGLKIKKSGGRVGGQGLHESSAVGAEGGGGGASGSGCARWEAGRKKKGWGDKVERMEDLNYWF
jgi:hypothetical protein